MHVAGSLRVYMYSEMLALFASTPYDCELTHLTDLSSHLTNTCCQAGSGVAGEDLVKLLSELPEVRARHPPYVHIEDVMMCHLSSFLQWSLGTESDASHHIPAVSHSCQEACNSTSPP